MRQETRFQMTEYQQPIIENPGYRSILIGGRQIGKTEAIIRRAADLMRRGFSVTIVAPTQRMTDDVRNRLDRSLDEDEVMKRNLNEIAISRTGKTQFASSWGMANSGRSVEEWLRDHSHVLVDEAHGVREDLLFKLDHHAADIVLTGTPKPRYRSIVDVWAESSPYWDTYHATMYDAPHVPDGRVDDIKDGMTEEQRRCEIYGEYERTERLK